MRVRAESPLRRTVRRMAARQQGVANDEVQGATLRQVARIVQHLIEDGALHKARLTGKNVRYFASTDDADAWLDAAKLAKRQAVIDKARERAVPEPDETVAPWPADAQPFFPADAHGRPAWKFTRCPPSMLGVHRTNTHLDTH